MRCFVENFIFTVFKNLIMILGKYEYRYVNVFYQVSVDGFTFKRDEILPIRRAVDLLKNKPSSIYLKNKSTIIIGTTYPNDLMVMSFITPKVTLNIINIKITNTRTLKGLLI